MKIENAFIYNQVKDETQTIHDLSKFDGEMIIMGKIIKNEELGYQEKVKIQTLAYNDKGNNFVVFFIQFLENYHLKQGQYQLLNENNYCFLRDMIYRIMIRRLAENKDFLMIFNLVYAFQNLRYELNGNVYHAKNDLINDEIFQNDDFWLSSFYGIFSQYKNKQNGANLNVKELLIANFISLLNMGKSKQKSIEIMKRVMTLNLGFSIEYILDESEGKSPTRNDLIFFKESDLETKRILKIF